MTAQAVITSIKKIAQPRTPQGAWRGRIVNWRCARTNFGPQGGDGGKGGDGRQAPRHARLQKFAARWAFNPLRPWPYSVEIAPAATRQFKNLDFTVARRLQDAIFKAGRQSSTR